ncbi:RluA family pseudouridine synthase [Acetivibrio ethanolgignens]|uniref:RNA pseudouridylate synthase n=1 Tax=Acetivibrio ethanolgignens TaxID=290052 RepID=A0A0V8QH26_9FIRM|nr:RNA pseudouridine synthase [Acetivibrio ethanolgignens]KSV59722.1 hypothetical protein ASU35_08195 [Acetivibrio ethanolgignens]
MELIVFYEDRDIIVCEKPAGVPSQSDRTQDIDMISKIKNYLREKEPEGGVPYVAAVHRLDRPVGGIVVYAKTPKAAAGISRQIQNGQMEKQYLAVVCGDFSDEIGKDTELCDYLKKDGRRNLSIIAGEKDGEAKKARLSYQVLGTVKDKEERGLSLLNVRLFTGRHHQIRVQLSQHLAGIWGDTKYNPGEKERAGFKEIALYSWQLSFHHPITGKQLSFESIPKKYPFSEFFVLKEKNK